MTKPIGSRKRAVVDASSAILLYKAGLFDRLLDAYAVLAPPSVFDEMTRDGYPGAEHFRKRREESRFVVAAAPAEHAPPRSADPNLDSLDVGERDSIRCFDAGGVAFVVTDDGRAARYCKERGIPSMNALLFPRILSIAGRLSPDDCDRKMETLIGIGRYSSRIIGVARHCAPERLLPFLP